MTDAETNPIEVLRCRYQSGCKMKGCAASATTILRGLDERGHHVIQWELCTPHSDQAIVREARKGRNVVLL